MSFLKKFFGGGGGKGERVGDKNYRVTFRGTENVEGAIYDVYVGRSRSDALAFLRVQEVKEEQRYIIVETSEGNIGKDLIAIFDEKTEEVLELGNRKPLPKLKESTTHCCRCGYSVLPAGQLSLKGATMRVYTAIEDMREKGLGFYCSECKTLWCSFCISLQESQPMCGICGKVMETFKSPLRF